MKTNILVLLALITVGCTAATIQQNPYTISGGSSGNPLYTPPFAVNSSNAVTSGYATNAGNATTANSATTATSATTAGSATTATTAATATTANALGGNPPSYFLNTNAAYGSGTLVLTWTGTNYVLSTNTVTGVFSTNTLNAGVVLVTTNSGTSGLTLWIGTSVSQYIFNLTNNPTVNTITVTNGIASQAKNTIVPGPFGVGMLSNSLPYNLDVYNVQVANGSGTVGAMYTNLLNHWGFYLPTNVIGYGVAQPQWIQGGYSLPPMQPGDAIVPLSGSVTIYCVTNRLF